MTAGDIPDYAGNIAVSGDMVLAASSLPGQTLTPSEIFPIYDGPIQGTSYQLTADILNTAASPAIPFGEVIVKFLAGTVQLDGGRYVIMDTNISPGYANSNLVLRGPTVASTIQVQIQNYDTNSVVCNYGLYSSGRFVARQDPRQLSSVITGTYTYGGQTFGTASGQPTTLLLSDQQAVNVVAGGNLTWISPVYAGDVGLSFDIIPASGGASATVTAWQVVPALAPGLRQVFRRTYTSSGDVSDLVTIPQIRSPLVVRIDNTAATAAATVTASVCPSEQAS